MKATRLLVLCTTVLALFCFAEDRPNLVLNPYVDYDSFLRDAVTVGQLRQTRRVTEDQFLRMSADFGTIVLDARSDSKFEMLHIKGAVHLSFTDFTAAALAQIIPSKDTRILIYCNNNFANAPVALASKSAPASLNIYTRNALFTYGYHNVFELGPYLDINTTKLPFVGASRAP
jgi:phage shock protein E